MDVTQDNGRAIGGIVLIGLGAIFLLAQVTGFDFGAIWPLFVIIPGTIFLAIALRGQDEKTAGFIFPGTIITGTGLILAYQNFTGHWESWAYIWALYPVMVGMALRYFGTRTGKTHEARVGQKLMIGWLIGFVAFGALFELFIFNGADISSVTSILPLAMIGGGLVMVFRSSQGGRKPKRKAHEI